MAIRTTPDDKLTRNKIMLARVLLIAVLTLFTACDSEQTMSSNAAFVDLLPSPAGPGSGQSHLAVTALGSVVVSWIEPIGDEHALRFSILGESEWGPAQTVAKGDSWFINWADFPSVVPISDELWAAHWLQRRPGGRYAYDVAVSVSTDSGKTWSDAAAPHLDGTATEHGFVTLYPVDAEIGVLWLDGRNMAEDHAEITNPLENTLSGMTLRSATITPNLEIKHMQLIDDLTCDCCQTDVAIGPDGPVAVYRNRDPDETRDIYVARSVAGKWTEGKKISNDGWIIAGCPVNGPAIAADGHNMAVAWFTAAGDRPTVKMAFSANAGLNFSDPVTIDENKPSGRVDIALLGDDSAIVSWLRMNEQGQPEISARIVSAKSGAGRAFTVAENSISRSAGVPQMISNGKYLIFAWVDASGENSQVLTAKLPLAALQHLQVAYN